MERFCVVGGFMQNRNSKQRGSGLLDRARARPGRVGAGLRPVLRARSRLLVCLLTLPVYGGAVWMLLEAGQDIDLYMYIYMVLWGVFAVDMAMRRCPRCGEQFYVKSVLLNIFSKRCVHCGLSGDE